MRMNLCLSSVMVLACCIPYVCAKPEPTAEYQSHHKNLAVMRALMAGPQSDVQKFQRLAEAMRQDSNPDHRRDLLALAGDVAGNARESFLISVMQSDADCFIRSAAATMLGRFGSETAITPLAKTAAFDAITFGQMGCMRHEGAARRSAIFALAELSRRLPKSSNAIIKNIRDLPEVDGADKRLINEHLGDVRRWALYQITEDRSLLATEFAQLKSADAKTRCNGVVAFRFLNLKNAPPELLTLARDQSPDVRSWVALVLGEIGDQKTIPLLIELVKDTQMDRCTRCNAIASLGQMRATNAQSLMENLLNDNDLKTNAAIALSLITGKRHPLVPEGYGGTDWPRNSKP